MCSLHPPSKLLLRSLTTTDLCVGLFSEPLYVTLLVTVVNEYWNICYYVVLAASIASSSLCAVSLLTLTAISVDSPLALLLGLRYRQVVTLKRIYLITVTFFVVSTAFSTIKLFSNSPIASRYNVAVVSQYLVISAFCYTKIFFTPSSSSKSRAGRCSTAEPNNSIEHSAIQKSGVQCTVVAIHVSRLLSTIYYISTEINSVQTE